MVLAVEKIISSKLLKPGANKRISTVDRNVGVVRDCEIEGGWRPACGSHTDRCCAGFFRTSA